MKKIALIFFFIVILVAIAFLQCAQQTKSSCIKCHEGIEDISENHKFDCYDCHRGDNSTDIASEAHKGMLGGKNPASPEVWELTCGTCHEYQVKRVKSSVMFTNMGVIKNTMLAWGELYDAHYGVISDDAWDAYGFPLQIKNVEELDTIAGELYRKLCASCHIESSSDDGYMAHKSSGCSACHFKYNEYGEYSGGDKEMRGYVSYAETHQIESLPTDETCQNCHNRSGRIALSYQGLYDGNNSMVPVKNAEPGPIIYSEARSIRHMPPDIHHEGGMNCIDCHTSYEIMGDGYYYENMFNQLEISCESCHGSGKELPKTQKAFREENNAFTDSVNYKQKVPNGAEMVLTDKGRMFSNVYKKEDSFFLLTKREGKELTVKTIKDTPEHKVAGHERLDCASCHSKVVIQCYGCHTSYDEREIQYDYIKKKETVGAFNEQEDIRTFYPFPLALNQKGKISPITPGCQTIITYIDKEGNYILKDYIPDFRERKKLKFAPFFSHNVGKKALDCKSCHNDPFFYGFGEGLFSYEDETFTSPMLCDACDKPLNSLISIKDGEQNISADIVRENSRVLSNKEIVNIINANKCIICHDKAEEKYYGRKSNYEKILSDPIHAPLLH